MTELLVICMKNILCKCSLKRCALYFSDAAELLGCLVCIFTGCLSREQYDLVDAAGLAKYEGSRNLADASAVSKLSPYIHFGQVGQFTKSPPSVTFCEIWHSLLALVLSGSILGFPIRFSL